MKDQTVDKLHEFFKNFPVQKNKKDDVILRAGSRDDYFFFVETGAVKMTATSGRGQNLVLHVFFPNSTFSFLTLINHDVNKYDFIALTNTTVYRAPQEKVVAFFKEDYDLLFDFQLRLLKGLQGLLNRIERQNFVPAYNQVAGLLLYFARHFTEHSFSNTLKIIEIKITHQEISEWLGLSRENVSIHMKQLERSKLIRKRGRLVEIVNIKKLERLADPYAA